MKQRSYNQYCGIAYALDIIGDRWTILIIRELIAGPRRFKDLLAGLPGISTNLLAERLKQLEQHGLVRRHTLPPPAGSAVYELTDSGQGLEQTLIELGRWGSQFVPPAPEGAAVLHASSYALTLKTFFRPEQAHDETYALHVGGERLVVRVANGQLDVRQGEAHDAVATFHTDPASYLRLLAGQLPPTEALSAGVVRVEGDPGALRRFLNACGIAGAAAP